MLGWLRRPKPSTDADAMEAAFHAAIRRVRVEMSESQRAAWLSGCIRGGRLQCEVSIWRLFPQEVFRDQSGLITSVEKMQNAMAERNDAEVAAGMALANMYFAALLALSENAGSAAMVNRMADTLEPFNREGTVLLNVGT
jgi:hypothetical protein